MIGYSVVTVGGVLVLLIMVSFVAGGCIAMAAWVDEGVDGLLKVLPWRRRQREPKPIDELRRQLALNKITTEEFWERESVLRATQPRKRWWQL